MRDRGPAVLRASATMMLSLVKQQGSAKRTGDTQLRWAQRPAVMPCGLQRASRVPFVSQGLRPSS